MSRSAVHPGQVLAEELSALGVTAAELARQIEVPANRISQIINGKRAITGDTALRLAHWFGTEPEFWMSLQSSYDVSCARQQAGNSIETLPKRHNAPGRPALARVRPHGPATRQSNKATT